MTMRRLEQVASSQRGQTLVLVGVVMLVLLGLAAMAVDVGEILWSRGAEQNAADAGALAGVRELPASPATAPTVGVQYAAQNGFGASSPPAAAVATVTANYSTTFNPNDTLTVTVNRDIPGGLRQAVGGGNINVPAEAVAIVARVKATCGFTPWAIEQDVLLYKNLNNPAAPLIKYSDSYGQKVILKQRTSARGSFLVIGNVTTSANGNGNQDYTTAIKEGSCLPVNPQGHLPDYGATTRKAVEDAINTVPPINNPPYPLENVLWEVSSTDLKTRYGGPGPYTGPYGTTDLPFGLGPSPCAGPPTATDNFPKPTVSWIPDPNNPGFYYNPCPRVNLVVIMPDGTTDLCPGNSSNCTIPVVDVAVFYLIGMEKVGPSDWYPVGAFIKDAVVDGPPDYGGGLDGPINYFLWR